MDLESLTIDTIADYLTSAISYVSGASSIVQTIIDTTISTAIDGILASGLIADFDDSEACLGNFEESYITNKIEGCDAMLFSDSSDCSIISFNSPIFAGICTTNENITAASFCLAIGKYGSLRSISIKANSGTLSCLTAADSSGAGKVYLRLLMLDLTKEKSWSVTFPLICENYYDLHWRC